MLKQDKTKLGLRQVVRRSRLCTGISTHCKPNARTTGGSLILVNDEQDVLMSTMQQDAAF